MNKQYALVLGLWISSNSYPARKPNLMEVKSRGKRSKDTMVVKSGDKPAKQPEMKVKSGEDDD